MAQEPKYRPLYRKLRDRLASDIATGFWKPGEAIASESSLANRHHVAVSTVRRAIDMLVLDGLVERIQGAGTFVRRPDFTKVSIRKVRCHGSAADERTPRSRLLERSRLAAPKEVATALNLELEAEVIRLLRLRVLDDVPVSVEEIWLEAIRFAPVLNMADYKPRLMYPIYEKLCGLAVARVEETVSIGSAGEAEAELLCLSLGSPVVLLDRLSLGYDGKPIEWRRVRAAALDLHYTIEIR